VHSDFSAENTILTGNTQLYGASIRGITSFFGAKVNGEINLIEATTAGLYIVDAFFSNSGGPVLRALRLKCSGRVVITNSHFIGRLNFGNSRIDGDLGFQNVVSTLFEEPSLFEHRIEDRGDLSSTTIAGETSPVLVLNMAQIIGNVQFGESSFYGGVYLHNSLIMGDLDVHSTAFLGESDALICDYLKINGKLCLKSVSWGEDAHVSMRLARIQELDDEPLSWPLRKGSIDLTGFEYQQFSDSEIETSHSRNRNDDIKLWDVERRLDWIGLQTRQRFDDTNTPGEYSPQPYLHLASVYERVGKDHERRIVLKAQQNDLRKYGDLQVPSRLWNKVVGITAGHGFEPWRAIVAIFAIYLASVLVVSTVKSNNGFVATGNTAVTAFNDSSLAKSNACTSEYPCMSVWLYPVDAAVPVINFHQSDFWQFNASNSWGNDGQLVFDGLMILGWAFTSLLIAASSGLIKQS